MFCRSILALLESGVHGRLDGPLERVCQSSSTAEVRGGMRRERSHIAVEVSAKHPEYEEQIMVTEQEGQESGCMQDFW